MITGALMSPPMKLISTRLPTSGMAAQPRNGAGHRHLAQFEVAIRRQASCS